MKKWTKEYIEEMMERIKNESYEEVQDVDELYPIEYKGKLWYKEDCHYQFVNVYDDKMVIGPDCGVYVAMGMYVYPDGEMGKR